MASGLFASYCEGIMSGTAADLTVANTMSVALYGNAATEQLIQAELEDEATDTLAEVNTASGSTIEGVTHDRSIASVTVGVSGPYELDAADTVMTSPDPVTSALLKDLLVGIDANTDGDIATTDTPMLAFWDLAGGAITPNGEQVTIQWAAAGLWQFGAAA